MSKDCEEIVKLYEEYKYRGGRKDFDGFIGYAKMQLEKQTKESIVVVKCCGHCDYSVDDENDINVVHCKKRMGSGYRKDHECHITGGFKEKQSTNKPPLGVKPCYIQSSERIKDLAEAISRYADRGDYEVLRKWAKEILMQCDIAEMEKDNGA